MGAALSREKLLGQARADLVALPDLVTELARLVADRHHDVTGYRGKVAGSPAPLSMPIVHLADTRHKARWHGEDPRYPTWVLTWGRDPATGQVLQQRLYASRDLAENGRERLPPADRETAHIHRWDVADQYGITATLESWVRILWEEMPEIPDLTELATVRSECATLVEHWDWIGEQQWAIDLAEDVTRLTATVKAHLGIKPEPEYRCPQCHNPAYLQPGGILACTEVPDHDVVVRDLEAQMRRRPALPTKDICAEFEVEPGTLRVWKHRRKIRPAPANGTNRDHWFPWDVFCLLNPDIAEGFATRDEVDAG